MGLTHPIHFKDDLLGVGLRLQEACTLRVYESAERGIPCDPRRRVSSWPFAASAISYLDTASCKFRDPDGDEKAVPFLRDSPLGGAAKCRQDGIQIINDPREVRDSSTSNSVNKWDKRFNGALAQ
jgi:hypothetical protein